MTKTPEERAEELWRGLPYPQTAMPIIAQAIREAEDAALERVAALYESEIDFDAAAIRALKQRD